jgi:hypothetical protein
MDHDIVLATLGNLALAQAKSEHFQKARKTFRTILRSQQARFGPESKLAVETTGMIGYLHMKEVELDDALKCMQSVQKWQKVNLQPSHPDARMANETIDDLEKCIKGRASAWI